jgi:hypothetical protein
MRREDGEVVKIGEEREHHLIAHVGHLQFPHHQPQLLAPRAPPALP